MDLDRDFEEPLDELEDIDELPEDRTIVDIQRPRRRNRRETMELARLLAEAGESPAGEILHDPDEAPLVRTQHDAELAILGLDPDSLHPICDWCEKEERHGLKPEVRGRWFMHVDCYVDAESQGLVSLQMTPREWEWDVLSPAPACSMRSKPRPAALTEEQIVTVVSLKTQWRLTQTEIAERLGVNQATVHRALRRAEEKGLTPVRLKPQQLTLDWFGEGAA